MQDDGMNAATLAPLSAAQLSAPVTGNSVAA
jgi:hypothetical protein